MLAFLENLFAFLGPSPHAALAGGSFGGAEAAAPGYRFIGPAAVRRFLLSVGEVLREEGSLESLYRRGAAASPREALGRFLARFRRAWGSGLAREREFLFPDPARGSACKRHNLFLRWMVRRGDGVDLGLWTALSPARLVVPLDTHVARLGRYLGLTARRAADWRAAEEITAALRAANPDDPLRYDYALAHLGIGGLCAVRGPRTCRACPLRPACRRAV